MFALIIILSLLLVYLGQDSSNPNPFADTVAVIPIQGEIAYQSSDILGGEITNPETIKQEIKEAEEDSSVAAILLEINSPGGSAVASEEVMYAVRDCKKPVVVWISDVGASGAYLAASAADKIVATPSSSVGSIGVILGITDLSRLYQNIGINRYSITGGEYKDMGAEYRPLTTEERNMLQEMVNQDYEYFISLVAENRKLDPAYVRSIAEGKIYTGRQAKEIKLIDELGNKKHALDLAAQLGGIRGRYQVITIKPPQTLETLLNSITMKSSYYLGRGIASFMNPSNMEEYTINY